MTLDPGGIARTPNTEVTASSGLGARKTTRGSPLAARILLLVAALAAVGLYLRASARVYRAFLWAENATLENLKTAARLEPSDAELRYRIGRYSLLMQDFPRAIDEMRAAIALNPFDARYWLDLASAYLASDDPAETQQALKRALEADPTMPDVVWRVANYELVQGDTAVAMQRFHTLVENDPESLMATLNVCWRATHDPDLITEEVLPQRPDSHFRFINFLRNKRSPEAPAKVWSHLIALRRPFPVQLAFPYIDHLIDQGEFAQAEEAWAQLAIANPEFRGYLPSDNLVVNGSFELDLLNGGLEWRYEAQQGVSVLVDDTRAHSGNRSLAITFEGAPARAGVFQFVPVRGNTRYQFSGFMMAEDLETISPPRFQVVGLHSRKSYLLTDGVTGSTGWRELQGEFTTDPEDDLLMVHIVRVPQRLIRGKLWVDDLKIVAKTRSGESQ